MAAKKVKSGDSLTPKQRQMMAAGPADAPRTWDSKKTSVTKKRNDKALPVLSGKGKWTSNAFAPERESEAECEDEPKHKGPSGPVTTAGKSFDDVRLEMANMALILTESPETGPGTMKRLGELRSLCEASRHRGRADGRASDLMQMAMLTTLTVLKDLMPGYTIRPLTAEELAGEGAQLVSKDVKAVRSFEQSFLGHYKAFLVRLQRVLREEQEDEALRFVACTCVCDLLQCSSHFNQYEELVKMVSAGALGHNQRIREVCCEAIETTLKEDEYGRSTLLLIRTLSDTIKDRDYQAPPSALASLRSARIRTDIAGHLPKASIVQAPRARKTMSKRDKKEHKKKMVEAQRFSDAEALVSKEEQEGWYSDALRYLFRVYFGVIKRRPDSPLITEVLRGLATFAHLLSQADYFEDLLRSLRAVMLASALPPDAALQCVLTVARVQALQDRVLAIDIKFVYNHLFALIRSMVSSPPGKDTIELLREALTALLGPRLGLPSVRIAAFAQRLADTARDLLNHDEEAAAGILSLLFGYLKEHRSIRLALLDREEAGGQGAYLPTATDPDLCSPYTRCIALPLDQMAAKGTPRIRSLVNRILDLAKLQ